jgi:iron complex outermembrane receptor protein
MSKPFPAAILTGLLLVVPIYLLSAPAAAQTSDDSRGRKATTLSAVKVHASDSQAGTLRSDRASLGPLGTLDRLDTPYSINVVPQQLIRNQQLKSIADALRYLPSVQGDGARPQSRGVQGSVVQNSRIDGFNAVSTTDYPLEQFERIEVLNGPAGGLYGPANPAGSFNYIQKRPTAQRLDEITLGYTGRGRTLGEADLSDRLGADQAFGYRLTVLDENGENYTPGSRLRRQLVSLAMDYQVAPGTRIETNYSHYRYLSKGLPASFSLANGVRLPAALDATRSAYAIHDGGNDNTTDTGSIKLHQNFGDNWQLVAGVLRQIADRSSTAPTNTLIDNQGDYRSSISTGTASRFTITSNMAYLQGTAQTGDISHRLSFGNSGFSWDNFNPRNGATVTLGAASLADPQSFALRGVPDFSSRYQSARATQQSLIAADDIGFNPQWSALLVGSQSWLSTDNYNTRSMRTSDSDNHGASGAASLVFKPRWNMSTYLTYADSLQQGDTAPVGSSNAGSILAPYRSRQWELGYKLALARVNLAVAAFRIQRPYAYTLADGSYGVAGKQVNRGIEVMLDGKATDRLSLFGGVSWLDPRLYDTGSAATSGKRIVGLPRLTFNMLAEYQIPELPGLTADFNMRYVGARPTDNANTSSVASYTTFDCNLGYRMLIRRHVTYVRFGINNLTNRRYWTNVYPGGLNGYTGAGNASATLGAPRIVQGSVTFDI